MQFKEAYIGIGDLFSTLEFPFPTIGSSPGKEVHPKRAKIEHWKAHTDRKLNLTATIIGAISQGRHKSVVCCPAYTNVTVVKQIYPLFWQKSSIASRVVLHDKECKLLAGEYNFGGVFIRREQIVNVLYRVDWLNRNLFTSLALLRLLMFSAMYFTLSIACLISGDTTEKATTVLIACGLNWRLTFPQSPSVASFIGWHGHPPFFPSNAAFPSPNSKEFITPCWDPLFFLFFPSPRPAPVPDELPLSSPPFPEDSDGSRGRRMSIMRGKARRKTVRTQLGIVWVIGVR